MDEKGEGLQLSKYWPFWGLHFAIHIIIGLVASIAGVIVIVTTQQIINGLACIGAGSFAMLNGWQGFKELAIDKEKQLNRRSKERNW